MTFPGLPPPHFRAKIETSSEAFSNQKPLKETKRVSIKLEAVRFLMAPLLEAGIPVTCSAWSLLQIELTKLILGFNDVQLFCPCHSLSLKWLYNAHTHESFHIVFSS